MNAVTHTEACAILTLEAADPTKNMILVPLSRLVLRPTGRNVRKTPRMSIPELAASMAAWWKPTAEGYFRHVPKAVILQAVGEFAPDQVNRLAKLKKADIASEAERLVEGTGWMPPILKAGGPQEVGPEEGAGEAAAVVDEPAAALTA